MRTVTYTRTAIKALKAVPGKDRNAIMAKMDRYAADSTGDVKALKGSDLFRLRHGDWRVVFEQDGTVVAVLNIGNRREIYR